MAANRALSPEESTLLEKYFREMQQPLYRAAASYLQSEHLAEDIVQDTFTYAGNHLEKLLESPEPKGWLYEVMKNLCRHATRDRKRIAARTVPLEEASLPAGDDGNFEINELDMTNEDMQLMERYFCWGRSLMELAEEKKISVGAVKMRIKRAKERLRKNETVKNLKEFYK